MVYQNAPDTTGNRHEIALTLSVVSDPNNNTSYTTLVGAGEVEIIETAGTIRGGRHGEDIPGPVTLTAFVGGDINGDSVVDTEDKVSLNRHLNGLAISCPERLHDLNGDGVVDTEDKLIINAILNGIPLP